MAAIFPEMIIEIPQRIRVRDLARQLGKRPIDILADVWQVRGFKSAPLVVDFEVASSVARQHGFQAIKAVKSTNPGKQAIIRIDEKITDLQVQVIDRMGKPLGIMSTVVAIKLAKAAGLNLVEIGPNAKPPLTRIMKLS